MELCEMTKINPESLQLGPGLEEAKGEYKPWSRNLALHLPSFNKFSVFNNIKPTHFYNFCMLPDKIYEKNRIIKEP